MKDSNISIKGIKELFDNEFFCLKNKIDVIILPVPEAKNSNIENIYNPGVYVFWKNNRVWKVGRHLENSRKRAFEHITDNTSNGDYQMKDLDGDSNAFLLLFNVKKLEDKHWVAAIEIFFEIHLHPIIPSARLG